MKRTVIITGGSKGIGEAISRRFYNAGYNVLIGARTDNGLSGKLGERARFESVDVGNEIAHRKLADIALNWTGRLDTYINCAGFSQWRPVNEVDEDFLDKMIATNLKGTLWGCKVAAEYMSEGGSIINISSLAGKRGSANNSVYCATKFAVNGITQSLAKELGPSGIRVNAVCPVYVKTDGVLAALKDKRSPTQGEDVSSYLENFAQNNAALQRLPTGKDVADLCLYLSSEGAAAITGQCINVDCGVLPQ